MGFMGPSRPGCLLLTRGVLTLPSKSEHTSHLMAIWHQPEEEACCREYHICEICVLAGEQHLYDLDSSYFRLLKLICKLSIDGHLYIIS